ncbi:MAG TPA: serine/threonine-protein kinase [Polyangia bacterium]|nr:serine/threonine-protein kinase [Polyangia bacterium]
MPPDQTAETLVGGRDAQQPLSPGELRVGTTIGRYIIIKMIGRGGAGEVYSAYDPDLDRRVALKLLRETKAATQQVAHSGLLREAKALARLSHPHVVAIHDVGSFGGRVFLAMDLIDGGTLREWMGAGAHPWRETLRVFAAAGHGLMAAHQAGLVHRDFKPENVMLTGAGHVRVSDFGLARPVEELSAAGEPSQQEVSLVESTFSGGELVGTPAYMSPEQFAGRATDARTDQFSFCVALYEALYGERPFAGDTALALAANVEKGIIRTEKRGAIPLAVRKVILRGLEASPNKRYPSLEPLLRDLDGLASRNRRRALIWSAVAAAAILTLVGTTMVARQAPVICLDGETRLVNVWDAPVKEQVRQAFMASKEPFAVDAFATISRAINDYARRWVETYTDACQATRVRGVQSAEVLDLRMACLQDRLGNLKSLTAIFVKADGAVVENAAEAASQLGDLGRCDDIKLLRSVMPPPDDPRVRRQLEVLQGRLADTRALAAAGRLPAAERATAQLVADVRSLNFAPMLAEVLELRGRVLVDLNAGAEAERALNEGIFAAEEGRHDEVKAEIAIDLVSAMSVEGGRPRDAELWARMSEAILRRIGGHERLQVWLNNNVGAALEMNGRADEGLAHAVRALTVGQRAFSPDDPDLMRVEGTLTNVLIALKRPEEALAHSDRGIEIGRKTLGADHPQVVKQISNRAEILVQLGRWDEARAVATRAMVLWERQLGQNHLFLSYALQSIGLSYLGEGKPVLAVAPLERALRLRLEKEQSPAHIAETEFALARALWDSGQQRDRARALAASARARYARITTMIKREDEVAGWVTRHRFDAVSARTP